MRAQLLLATFMVAVAVAPVFADSTTSPTVTLPPSAARVLSWKPKPWLPPYALLQARAGMRVSVDPVTGLFEMPTDTALEELARVGIDAPVRVDLRADGSRRAHLDDRFAEFAVIRLGADGRPRWTCVHSKSEAEAFVKSGREPVSVPLPLPGTTWEVK